MKNSLLLSVRLLLLLFYVSNGFAQQILSVTPNKVSSKSDVFIAKIVGDDTQMLNANNKVWLSDGAVLIPAQTNAMSDTHLEAVFSTKDKFPTGIWDLYYVNSFTNDTLILPSSIEVEAGVVTDNTETMQGDYKVTSLNKQSGNKYSSRSNLTINTVSPIQGCVGDQLTVQISGGVFNQSTSAIHKAWINKGGNEMLMTDVSVINPNLVEAQLDITSGPYKKWHVNYAEVGVDTAVLKKGFLVRPAWWCWFFSKVADTTATSTTLNEAIPAKKQIKVYPNPASKGQSMIIDLSNVNEDATNMIIYNIEGRVVKRTNNINDDRISLSLSTFSAGIYWIQIKTESGIYTSRFKVE